MEKWADGYKASAMTKSRYGDICALENATKFTLFYKKNNKVSSSVIIIWNEMCRVRWVFDTGAVLYFNTGRFSLWTMAQSTKYHISEKVKIATNERVHVDGTINLRGIKCDCHLPVVYGVVKNLDVPVVCGTSIAYHFVKKHFLSEWRIILYQSSPV